MITVIADDLTGAAEIAGICLRYGIKVSFGIDTIPEKSALVTIIATDSRSMTEIEAYETHRELTKSILEKNKNTILFKKCDSALRGHIVSEITALLEITNKESVLLQPSNPAANRCIQEGSYWLNGVLLEETGFASDPDFPTTKSLVRYLLLEKVTEHSNINKIHIGTINQINSKGIFVPDCTSVDELAKCVELYNDQLILGGSAAFFEQFLLTQFQNLSKKTPEEHHFSEHYLLISGSTQPESIQFAKSLQESNCPLILFPNSLLELNFETSALTNWINNIVPIYIENRKLCLRISDIIIQFEGSSTHLKNRLSLAVKQLLEQTSIDEIFIEGGATAYDVLQKLGWKSFTPIAELSLGVVRMQYDLNPKKHLTIKPGSYHWPNKLLH